ncbi:MAG: iron-sulfur cluster assembly scaffold protein [Candidatus Pacearchaeota archaeon]
MYSQKIIRRFQNPKFAGEIKNPDAVGQEGNMKCGDVMRIFLKVDKKTKKIIDIKFKTYGCVAAIAASDAMCELAKGKTLEEAKKISYDEIIKKMGGEVPNIKIHCSVLGTQALRNAIKDYEKKR